MPRFPFVWLSIGYSTNALVVIVAVVVVVAVAVAVAVAAAVVVVVVDHDSKVPQQIFINESLKRKTQPKNP